MNISQVEDLLGMTRANVRFYEQEGLVSPRREQNGYRDYSEADVDTLRKIKLLRQLGLSLEAIRQVQRGERTLDAALAERERALEQERSDLAWAAQLCRQMRQEQAEYAALDAKRYLEQLDRPADQPGQFDLRRDAIPTVSHPWRRFFARNLDMGLYSLLWAAVRFLVFRWNPQTNLVVNLVDSYISYGLMLLIEPLLLSTLGTTLGKAVFGLEVRNAIGGRLTYGQALERTWALFGRGEGYGIPIYALYRNYKSYRACSDGEFLPWELGLSYTIRDTHPLRGWGYVGLRALQFGLAVLLALQALLPRYRGDITPEQYALNINDAARFNGVFENYRMDSGGNWQKIEQPGVFVFEMGSSSSPVNHQLTVENGAVTAVHLESEYRGEQFYYIPTVQLQLAALSFGAASGHYNCVSWALDGLLEDIQQRGLSTYTLETHGLRITQEVDQEGFASSDLFLIAEEGDDTYIHWSFTIELL